MRSARGANFRLCSDLVRKGDEDRWLAAHYAPLPARAPLIALYALHLEIKRVPLAVSEPPLGEIRLQWWREAVHELVSGAAARAHPVIEAVRECAIVDGAVKARLDGAIDARARALYGESFASLDDLADWLRRAEAAVDALAADRLAPLDGDLRAAVETAALANALARFGPASAPDLAADARSRAQQLHAESAAALRAAPPALLPAIAHFALTQNYARDGRAPSILGKRVRIFAAVAGGRV